MLSGSGKMLMHAAASILLLGSVVCLKPGDPGFNERSQEVKPASEMLAVYDTRHPGTDFIRVTHLELTNPRTYLNVATAKECFLICDAEEPICPAVIYEFDVDVCIIGSGIVKGSVGEMWVKRWMTFSWKGDSIGFFLITDENTPRFIRKLSMLEKLQQHVKDLWNGKEEPTSPASESPYLTIAGPTSVSTTAYLHSSTVTDKATSTSASTKDSEPKTTSTSTSAEPAPPTTTTPGPTTSVTTPSAPTTTSSSEPTTTTTPMHTTTTTTFHTTNQEATTSLPPGTPEDDTTTVASSEATTAPSEGDSTTGEDQTSRLTTSRTTETTTVSTPKSQLCGTVIIDEERFEVKADTEFIKVNKEKGKLFKDSSNHEVSVSVPARCELTMSMIDWDGLGTDVSYPNEDESIMEKKVDGTGFKGFYKVSCKFY